MTVFITCFSLLYVYQQTEIFRLGYVGQKRMAMAQDLLDRNNLLRYNIQKNISLAQIGGKISASKDFQMPDTYHLVRLSPSQEGAKLNAQAQNKESLFSRIFGVKRQAEARTLSP